MAKLLWKDKQESAVSARLGQWLEVSILRVFWWITSMLPPQKASALGARLFGRLGPRSAKHRHVLANLRMARPDLDEATTQSHALGVWRNIGSLIAEYPHLGEMMGKGDQAPYEIIYENQDPDFLSAGKPYIFVAAHLGNIYFSADAICKSGFPVDLVYSPLTNPMLDRYILNYVSVLDCGFITKQNALRPMLKALKQGRSVGIHVDVRVDEGEMVPLCGEDAITTPAPAFLSVKTGAQIIPVRTERLPGARFRVTLFPPLDPAPEGCSTDEAIRAVTEQLNRVIGGLIQEHPEQWMCTKRRWPKQVMREQGVYRG